MNYLAHALLAGGEPQGEVGGVLGDFVRGQPDPALPEGLRRGIALHRAVDAFTDRHPRVLVAKGRFEPPWRRYAGILLDVWFDHCLARDFGRWAPRLGQELSLGAFSRRLRQRIVQQSPWLPPAMLRFLDYMNAHDLPAAYANPATIARVLAGLSRRLSRTNPLDRGLPVLQALDTALQGDFEAFFPDLAAFAQAWRAAAGRE